MAIYHLPWRDAPPAECRGGAIAIGNFDGVHRGHRALVDELKREARAIRGPAVAVTFDPHPLQILRPEQFMPLLTTVADRAEYLHDSGADRVIVLEIDPALLHLRAAEFFDLIIVKGLATRAVVEGFNFGFGRDREGNVGTLATLCQQSGLVLRIVPPLLVNGI